ncbi:hypothetical protein HPB50_007833 [Hyalomma asiaticum]|uniref:Uncharacterized protein n=1 Tax=Hyalomma asiaticum TaxID=266040 RepID=A0ACB7SF71_HYAAI|nr:hypothetical protein HPB50_007833 [Hyalomma asiaticum]
MGCSCWESVGIKADVREGLLAVDRTPADVDNRSALRDIGIRGRILGSAQAMAPEDCALWEHSTYLNKMCPGKFPSTFDAYARLHQMKAILSNKGNDIMVPCRRRSHGDCDLLGHVYSCNDILAAIKVQLKEVVATRDLAVLFPSKISKERETNERMQRAFVLLHWVLVKHSCVSTIELDSLGQFNDPDWLKLLCDGICHCLKLEKLKIGGDVGSASSYRQLLNACSSLEHLEHISLGRKWDADYAGNSAILAAAVRRNKNLMRLDVGNTDAITQEVMRPLLSALALKRNLSHLSVNVTSFRAVEAALLLQMLNGNKMLKSLRLVGSGRQKFVNVHHVAAVLAEATAMVELEFVGFFVHTNDAWTLAMSLVDAQSVKRLDLLNCLPVFSHPGFDKEADGVSGRIKPYLYLLQNLRCLQKFSLDLLRFTSEDQRALLEALAGTDSLHEVTVTSETRGYPTDLCRLAVETGTANRTRFGSVFANEALLADVLRGPIAAKVDESVQTSTRDNRGATLKKRCDDLRMLDLVTEINFEINEGVLEANTAELLAAYLKVTRCLKTIRLNFRATKASTTVLLDGIARNRSINSLSVERWCSRRGSAAILADIVRSSKIIHTVVYNKGGIYVSKAFFSRLSEFIENNFTIVSIKTFERRRHTKNWNVIRNVATRNAAFLEWAARHVVGLSFEKSSAEALELLASSPLLPLRVQELASVSECQAASMIRKAVKSLKDIDVFMSITGVVRESVVCEESTDGRPRLDTLPLDCWLAIRPYLRVADVVNTRSIRC